eukprot:1920197-Pyramimonas_sp.AAC.1
MGSSRSRTRRSRRRNPRLPNQIAPLAWEVLFGIRRRRRSRRGATKCCTRQAASPTRSGRWPRSAAQAAQRARS